MRLPSAKTISWVKDNGDKAAAKLSELLRVHTIPDTNMIELTVDPAVGDDAAELVEALANQYIENQNLIAQNKQLERSVILNNLKQRYQFRKDELSREVREKVVQLSIDGMGMPGRPSLKEIELQKLMELRFDLERKKSEAAAGDRSPIDQQLKLVSERLDAAKTDYGDLTNSLDRCLALKDEEQTVREMLRQINRELEQISQMSNANISGVRWVAHPAKW
jgi:hypothetical protein